MICHHIHSWPTQLVFSLESSSIVKANIWAAYLPVYNHEWNFTALGIMTKSSSPVYRSFLVCFLYWPSAPSSVMFSPSLPCSFSFSLILSLNPIFSLHPLGEVTCLPSIMPILALCTKFFSFSPSPGNAHDHSWDLGSAITCWKALPYLSDELKSL